MESEMLNFEISRKDLLALKFNNNELYNAILALKKETKPGLYCETLDKVKLANECALEYFNITDLFTKKQILAASQDLMSIKTDADSDSLVEKYIKTRVIPCPSELEETLPNINDLIN